MAPYVCVNGAFLQIFMTTKKNLNMKNLLIAITLVLFLITSCGESVDSVKGEVSLEMKAVSNLNTINSNGRVAETGIEFTEVLLGVTEIELESESEAYDNDENEYEYEIEFEGQFIVDLLNGTSDPDFGISNVFPGEYNELEIQVSPILDDGNSISIKFNITMEGADPVPVELSTSKEFEIEIEHEGGFKVDLNDINQILVLFDLDKLLGNLDLSSLKIDEDGVLRINENSNKTALMSIWQALYHAFDAGEDNDDEFDDDDSDDD